MADYIELEEKEKRFVNPYHFVSLGGNCRKDFDYREQRKEKGALTGRIQCEIETLTPVFIPNSSSIYETAGGEKCSDVFGKRAENNGIIKSYDFFSYTPLPAAPFSKIPHAPEPVIPGSEIRGVIRSAFEAVTNSCLSTIDDEQQLFKRVQSPAKPGRLVFDSQKNQWLLVSCNKYRLPDKWIDEEKWKKGEIYIGGEKYNEGEKVYVLINHKNFKVVKISKKDQGKFKEAFLHIGEYNENKNYEGVFAYRRDRNTQKNMVTTLDRSSAPKILNNLVENVLLYGQKANKTENHNQYRHFEKSFGKLKSIRPLIDRMEEKEITYDGFIDKLKKDYKSVFNYLNGALVHFALYNDKYYLSPAAIGREVFHNTLTKIVGSYKPCLKLKELCCACSLFGIAGKGEAAASRVRFADARVIDKKENSDHYYHGIRILKELASPKLSATEFYLEKNPGHADTWNYDYAINWRSHKNGIPEYKPRIRGRKFYWHQPHGDPYIKLEDEQNPDAVSERNVAVRPLTKGNRFKFTIYYNNVTAEELGKLLWVLQIGQHTANAHKIGMGKPIGLGSVRFSVSDVFVRTVSMENRTIRYRESKPDQLPGVSIPEPSQMNHRALGCSEGVLKEFLTVTEFEHPYEPVEYPTVEGKAENYLWFGANKQIKGTGTKPVIHQPLPPIESPWLKKYKEAENRAG